GHQDVGAAAAGIPDRLGGAGEAGPVEHGTAEHGGVGTADRLPDRDQGVGGLVEEVSGGFAHPGVGDHDQERADQEGEHEAHHDDQHVAADDLVDSAVPAALG